MRRRGKNRARFKKNRLHQDFPRRMGYIDDHLGNGYEDDVPALLTAGEYVIRRDSTQKYGERFLDRLNRGLVDPSKVTHLNRGGKVNRRKNMRRRPVRRNMGGPISARKRRPRKYNTGGSVRRYNTGGGVRRYNNGGAAMGNDRGTLIDNTGRGMDKYVLYEGKWYDCPGPYFTSECEWVTSTQLVDPKIGKR